MIEVIASLDDIVARGKAADSVLPVFVERPGCRIAVLEGTCAAAEPARSAAVTATRTANAAQLDGHGSRSIVVRQRPSRK